MTDHPGDLIAKYHRDKDVYFLIGYDDQGNILTLDGGHSCPEGVAKALELHQQLWPSGLPGRREAFWKMAIYTAVPEYKGSLDMESIGQLPVDSDTIDDGYQSWSAWCPMCGRKSMQVVRPGKVQCQFCG